MSRNCRSHTFRPAVEALEDRRLPALIALPPITVVHPIIAPPPVASLPAPSAPVAFGSQDALRQWLINDALVRYKGLFGQHGGWWATPVSYLYAGEGVRALTADAASVQTAGYSSTNDQVQGVDEGDLVKTDGNYLYLISGGNLIIMQAQPAGALHVISRTALEGQASALYLDGDRVTILSYFWPGSITDGNLPAMYPYSGRYSYTPVTKLTVFDVSDPTAPRTVQEAYARGFLLASRAVGDRVYLVLDNSYAVLPAPLMQNDGEQCSYETQDQYLARITGHELDLALPRFYTRPGGPGTPLQPAGFLTDPASLYQPGSAADTDLISVLDFDVTSSSGRPVGGAGVYAGYGAVIYANADHIDVVSPVGGYWGMQGSMINQFSLDGDGVALTARGVVPGRVLNQYSLDESGGYLRIATQIGWGWGNGASSAVYVLAPQAGVLTVVGSVDGLGAGEWLRSVRFMGDRAYLCTSESWDPVYVIDLGDPTAPRLAGEVQLPGFSSYLQPLDATHLLGVGRDSPHGQLRLALFDVSDPTAPVLVDQYVIEPPSGDSPWWGSGSLAEFDPHALSYFPETHTLALPFRVYGYLPMMFLPLGILPNVSPPADVSRLEVFQVDPAAGFHFLGHVDQDSSVLRSLRIGDTLYSVATDSVKAVPLDDPSAPGTEARMTDDPSLIIPGFVGPVQEPGPSPGDPGQAPPPTPPPTDPPADVPGSEAAPTPPPAPAATVPNALLVQALVPSGSLAGVSAGPAQSPPTDGSAAAPAPIDSAPPVPADGTSPYDKLSGGGSSVSADQFPALPGLGAVSDASPVPVAQADGLREAPAAARDAFFALLPLDSQAAASADESGDRSDLILIPDVPAGQQRDGSAGKESVVAVPGGVVLLVGSLSGVGVQTARGRGPRPAALGKDLPRRGGVPAKRS